MRSAWTYVLGVASFFGLWGTAHPQEPLPIDLSRLPRTERLPIPRLDAPVTLDGFSTEPAWGNVQVFPFIMQMPAFGERPSERTEALLAFDDDFLYVAGRLFDREPSKIQAPTKKRDATTGGTDWFAVILDTFNDKENGLGFGTTPSGLRYDAAVFNDGQGDGNEDMPLNRDWNAVWDVAVARSDEGWFVEMRIPLSSLRFERVDGRVVMGLLIFRWIARKNEQDIFPAVPLNWGEMSCWKPSQAQEVEFIGLRPHSPLDIVPYVLAGGGRTMELNDAETAYVSASRPKFQAGLDVKFGLTPNLTVDLTLNPDFAQVEADEAQVNLTRFSLFFPEKRLFFQERASNLEFGLGGQDRLFYSRRIGLQGGRPVPIIGGVRIVGRLRGWDVGFLDMQTASFGGRSSENFGVFRMRRRVFNSFSYLGLAATSRIGQDGAFNIAYGLDGIIRLFGDDYLTFDWAQSFRSVASARAMSLDPSHFGLTWKRRTQVGPGYHLSFFRSGPDFEPGVGFLARPNTTQLSSCGLYGWNPRGANGLSRHSAFLQAQAHWSNATGRLESLALNAGWNFLTRRGWSGTISPQFSMEKVAEAISFGKKTEVPPGQYESAGIKAMAASPPGGLLFGVFAVEAGSFYDGRRLSAEISPVWSGIKDVEISGLLQYNRIRFQGRGQEFIAPLARLSLLATLSTQFSASAFVQYDGETDSLTANFRLRYNPREGTDIYFIFNQGWNTDRFGINPVPPPSRGGMILLKASTAFRL